MTSTTLDYSSWLFQAIGVLAIIYLALGLTKPSLVKATRRSTVAIVAAIVLIAASTAFYFVASKLPGGTDTPAQIEADIQQTSPTQP